MAMNAAECEQMIAAAERAGVLLGVAHVFRFAGVVQAMHDHVQSGAIGRPLIARGEFSFPGLAHARTWIHDRTLGGGVVNDVGIHCLDSLRWILGDEPVDVQSVMTHDEHSGDVEASGSLNLRFRGGVVANIVASMRTPYRTLLEIAGEGGRISCENALALGDPGPLTIHRANGEIETHAIENGEAFVMMIENFADAVEGRTEFRVRAEEGWRNQRVMDAAYESVRTGCTIRLQ
jgi:predicted dehydrogenase